MVQPDFKVSDDPAAAAVALLAETTGHLCITGGSTPRAAYEQISALRASDVWFTDERCVPPDHEHSNFRMANEALLARLSGVDVHRMKGARPGRGPRNTSASTRRPASRPST